MCLDYLHYFHWSDIQVPVVQTLTPIGQTGVTLFGKKFRRQWGRLEKSRKP